MYIVTGGAGFIGSNILAELEKRADGQIIVCDRLRQNDKWRNIAKRDLADIIPPEHLLTFLDAHADQVKTVIHMGAISATTEKDADLIIENNFRLSLALWRWCAAHDVRFIYASSAATYGGGEHGFIDDASIAHLARLRPLNAYGWSKHLFDRNVARMIEAGEKQPPQWAGLKFFNVYGPNEYHKIGQMSVVAQAFDRAIDNQPFSLFRSHNPAYGDGGQLRDFIWVEDCVSVISWLLDNPSLSGLFNVGTGQARSFLDLATAVYRALGKEPMITFQDTPAALRSTYQYFTQASLESLRKAGYDRPFTSLEEGVRRYVQDYLASSDRYQ